MPSCLPVCQPTHSSACLRLPAFLSVSLHVPFASLYDTSQSATHATHPPTLPPTQSSTPPQQSLKPPQQSGSRREGNRRRRLWSLGASHDRRRNTSSSTSATSRVSPGTWIRTAATSRTEYREEGDQGRDNCEGVVTEGQEGSRKAVKEN